MNDDNQLPLPASFIALFVPRGASRPTASFAQIAERYALCEDMAQMLTEHAQAKQFELGIDEATVLHRMLQGLQGSRGDKPTDQAGPPQARYESGQRDAAAAVPLRAEEPQPGERAAAPTHAIPADHELAYANVSPTDRARDHAAPDHPAPDDPVLGNPAPDDPTPSPAVLPPREAEWVIRRLAELLDWPPLPLAR